MFKYSRLFGLFSKNNNSGFAASLVGENQTVENAPESITAPRSSRKRSHRLGNRSGHLFPTLFGKKKSKGSAAANHSLTRARRANLGFDMLEPRQMLAGDLDLVTLGNPSTTGGFFSYDSSMSDDGRYVAFTSGSKNLVSIDSSLYGGLFVKDFQSGTITLVSTDANGNGINSVDSPVISGNGRYVVFYSSASNIVPEYPSGGRALYRKDIQTGEILRVNLTSSGTEVLEGTYFTGERPSISDDGRYVTFGSFAAYTSGETGNFADIYRKDMETGEIIRVSTTTANAQANESSLRAVISGDGRYVVFASTATNLVSGDTNGDQDLFRKDIQTGTLVRISVSSTNVQANDYSHNPSISSDGRYVSFYSKATNLVSADTNNTFDYFRKDIQTGAIVLVNTSSSNAQTVEGTFYADSWSAVSDNGRYVVFPSYADDLVSGDTNDAVDIFRKDLQTGTIVRVSTNSASSQANGDSEREPTLSANGQYVSFASFATNLVSGDSNGATDIFRKNLSSGATEVVSGAPVLPSGGNTDSDFPSTSSDGKYLVFESEATNLVANDTNGYRDIFVRNLVTGVTTLVSTATNGTVGNGMSSEPAISADGRFVTFVSLATNLVAGDTNVVADVFRKDLISGTTIRVSTNSSSSQVNSSSSSPSISADGRYIAFASQATNLITGDTNSSPDIFRKDIQTGTVVRVSTTASVGQVSGHQYFTAISGNGEYVTFVSDATTLVLGDTNGTSDIFRKNVQTGEIVRVNTNSSGGEVVSYGYNESHRFGMSSDGRYVTFSSIADNLVPNDTNTRRDVFVKDLNTGSTVRANTDASGNQSFGEHYSGFERIGLGGEYYDYLNSMRPTISDNGRYVTFRTYAGDLVPGDSNYVSDVFRKDLLTGLILRISTSNAGVQGDGTSFNASMNGSGDVITFVSSASTLDPPNAPYYYYNIYVAKLSHSQPGIDDQNFSVAEDNDGTSSFVTVVATDADLPNDVLTYSITGGTGALFFTIDQNTGALSVSSPLDYETETSYTLEVTVTDAGNLSDSATITIDVSNVNEVPTGTDAAFTIDENTDLVFAVADFGFNDPDGPLSSFWGLTISSLPVNGVLTLNDVPVSHGQFIFGVAISSGRLKFTPDSNESGLGYASFTFQVEDSSSAIDPSPNTILIHVLPVNDNAPIFSEGESQTFTIPEDSGNGSFVGSGAVTDADLPGDLLTYSITASDPNPDGFLLVKTSTGFEIYISDVNRLDLDYENGAYVAQLGIEVSDGVHTDYQLVTINVSATNENAPIFTAGTSQTLSIPENSLNGTIVGTAVATDADLPGDTLTYSIVDGDPNDGFAIDSNGQITIADASQLDLDFENGALVATIIVEVSDGELIAQQTVAINVTNVNEITRITQSPSIDITMSEDANPDAFDLTLDATDEDNDALTWNIVGSATHGTASVTTGVGLSQVINYVPNANYHGTDSFIVQVDDGNGGFDEITVNVTINPVNDAPVINAANYNLKIYEENGSPVIIFQAANEIFITDMEQNWDGGKLTVQITSNAFAADRLSIVATGDTTLSGLDILYNGVIVGTLDSLTVSGSGTLVITFNAMADNDAVTAVAHSVTFENTSDDPSTTFRLITFTAIDGLGAASAPPATVSFGVDQVNDAPTITSPNTASINENTNSVFQVTYDDAEFHGVIPSIEAGNDGSLFEFVDYELRFIAAPNFELPLDGNSDNQYIVTVRLTDDGSPNGFVTQTITVTVNPLNDNSPVFSAGSTQTLSIPENSLNGTVVGSAVAADADLPGDTLTYSIISGDPNGGFAIDANGQITIINAGALDLDFDNGALVATLIVRVSDGQLTADQTVTVNVTNLNEAPVITEGASVSVTMSEDSSPDAFDLILNATDVDNDTITWSIAFGASNGTATVSGTGASQVISYIPNANYNGPDSFMVRIEDELGEIDSITVHVTIDPVNDAPEITEGASINVTMSEDGSPNLFDLILNATDIDSSTLTWSILTGPANGGASIASLSPIGASKRIEYIPDANYNGIDSFVVRVSDGNGGFDDITVNVTIQSVNDAPEIITVIGSGSTSVNITMSEDSSPTAFNLTLDAADTESNTLTWSIETGAAHGIASVSGTGTTKVIHYVPNANYHGTDSFVVEVDDGNGGIDTITINVTIDPENDAPTAANDSLVTDSLNPVTKTLLGSDIDSSFTYEIVTYPTKGTLVLTNSATGAYTYTPNVNSSGTDSFTYRVRDAQNELSNIATVSINYSVTAVQIGNRLVITGTGGIDSLELSRGPGLSLIVTGIGTLVNGGSTPVSFSGITIVEATLLNGDDSLWAKAPLTLDVLTINTGDGNDRIVLGNDPNIAGNNNIATQTFRDGEYLRVKQSLVVNTGDGNDLVYERKMRVNGTKSLDLGAGNDTNDVYWSLADAINVVGGIGRDKVILGYLSAYGVATFTTGDGIDFMSTWGSRFYENVTFNSGADRDTNAYDVSIYDKNVFFDTGTGNDSLLFARSTVAGLADLKTGDGDDLVRVGQYISGLSPTGTGEYSNGGSTIDRLNLDTGIGIDKVQFTANSIRQFFGNLGAGLDDITIQENIFHEESWLDGGPNGTKLNQKNNGTKLRFRNI